MAVDGPSAHHKRRGSSGSISSIDELRNLPRSMEVDAALSQLESAEHNDSLASEKVRGCGLERRMGVLRRMGPQLSYRCCESLRKPTFGCAAVVQAMPRTFKPFALLASRFTLHRRTEPCRPKSDARRRRSRFLNSAFTPPPVGLVPGASNGADGGNMLRHVPL